MKKVLLILILLFSSNFLIAQEEVFVQPQVTNEINHTNNITIDKYYHNNRIAERTNWNIQNNETLISFISPLQNEINVPKNTSIEVNFNIPVDSSSINDTTIFIIGDKTGYYKFFHTMIYDSSNKCIGFALYPTKEFKISESISVILTDRIIFEDTSASIKFVWKFTVETKNGTANYSNQNNFSIGVPTYSPWHLTGGDLDNDNDVDIITANPGGNISVLLNDGYGIFSVLDVYPVQGFPLFVITADYNKDGFLDVSVASDTNMYVFFNNGDATMGTPSVYSTAPPSAPWERISSLSNSDVNSDGFVDIIAANGMSGVTFAVFLNNGNGTFFIDSFYVVPTYNPYQIVSCDFDNDGDLDVIYSAQFSKVITLYGNIDGKFLLYNSFPADGELNSIYCNDFNNDNFVDVLLGTGFYSPQDNKIIMLFNDGSGFFTVSNIYTVLTNPNYALGSDLNSDGYLDVACAHNYNNNHNVSVLLNDSTGLLNSPTYFGNGTWSPFAAITADFDNNETVDIAVANAGGTNISVFYNEKVTGINEQEFFPINDFVLYQNYPNPFNPNTTIKFEIPQNGLVTLKIYNILGAEIATLVNEDKSVGRYEVIFNASSLASGIYIYKIQVNGFVDIKKMILIK